LKHDFARKLRREQTNVERKLWFALRDRQFDGYKFRRQQPIGPYIVDFVCFETRLVIELDGGQHGSDEAIAYDKARTRFLNKDGFRVLRVLNHELNTNFDGVLEAIERRMRG
jgi:very-short-patch-repair endonuclease